MSDDVVTRTETVSRKIKMGDMDPKSAWEAVVPQLVAEIKRLRSEPSDVYEVKCGCGKTIRIDNGRLYAKIAERDARIAGLEGRLAWTIRNQVKDRDDAVDRTKARIIELEKYIPEWTCRACNEVFPPDALNPGVMCLTCPKCGEMIKPAWMWKIDDLTAYVKCLEEAFLELYKSQIQVVGNIPATEAIKGKMARAALDRIEAGRKDE